MFVGKLSEIIQEKLKKKKISPTAWLEKNRERLQSCALVTHVGKCTHPLIKNLSFWDSSANEDTGYLTTASAGKRQDIATDTAECIGLASVLVQDLTEGKTVLEHFQEDPSQIREEVTSLGVNYEDLRRQVVALKKATVPKRSDPALKQVYFPVGDGAYHLLSLFPSTSLLSAVRAAIQNRKEPQKTSTVQEEHAGQAAPSEQEDHAYAALPHVTRVHFGGGQPQNVSALSMLALDGKAGMFMLPSIPPRFTPRKIRLPRRSFFADTVPRYWHKETFQRLYYWIQSGQSRSIVKGKIDRIGWELANHIQLLASRLRELPPGWSEGRDLTLAERYWLDTQYTVSRQENTSWMEEVSINFGQWVIAAYQRWEENENKQDSQFKKGKMLRGESEVRYLAAILHELLQEEVRRES